MKYVCITPCYWGADNKSARLWGYGEICTGPPMIKDKNGIDVVSHHFERMDGGGDPEMKTDSIKELDTMTKKQINDKYNLGLDDKQRHFTNKKAIMQMVIDKL